MRKSKIMAAALAAVMLVSGVVGVSAATVDTQTTGVGIGFSTPGTIIPPTPGTGSLVLNWIPAALNFGNSNALPAIGGTTYAVTGATDRWIEVEDSRNAVTGTTTNEWKLSATLSALTDGVTPLTAGTSTLSFDTVDVHNNTGSLSVPNTTLPVLSAANNIVGYTAGATVSLIDSASAITLMEGGVTGGGIPLADIQAAMHLNNFNLTVLDTAGAVAGGNYVGTVTWQLDDTI